MLRSVAMENVTLARFSDILTVPHTISMGLSSGCTTGEIRIVTPNRAAKSWTR